MKMKVLDSFLRVGKKETAFKRMFGYGFPDQQCIVYGPQEESDALEKFIDKSLRDKKDYVADYLGYDIEETLRELEERKGIFIDADQLL